MLDPTAYAVGYILVPLRGSWHPPNMSQSLPRLGRSIAAWHPAVRPLHSPNLLARAVRSAGWMVLVNRRCGSRCERFAAVGLGVMVCAGCGPSWHLDFESAERQARVVERPILVFYKDSLDLRSSRMEDLLEGPQLAPFLKGKLLCMLISEYPPNRRFAGQYGILQPPGLALIHPDGTYHFRNGPMTLTDMENFFTNAKPPGTRPTLNPQIPRSIDYSWEGVYEDAVAKARRLNRELLIVYKWWLSPESTELLTIFQTRPEVARHFTETVNCLLDLDYAPNRLHVRKYGVTQVPSVILVHRDGTYHAHSGPMTPDQIVRFVTSAKAPGKTPQPAP